MAIVLVPGFLYDRFRENPFEEMDGYILFPGVCLAVSLPMELADILTNCSVETKEPSILKWHSFRASIVKRREPASL